MKVYLESGEWAGEPEEPSHSLGSAGGGGAHGSNATPASSCQLLLSPATIIIICHTSGWPRYQQLSSHLSVQVRDTRELSNRNFSYKFWLFSVLIISTPHILNYTLSFYCFCSKLFIPLAGSSKPTGMPPVKQKFLPWQNRKLFQVNQNQERNMLSGI